MFVVRIRSRDCATSAGLDGRSGCEGLPYIGYTEVRPHLNRPRGLFLGRNSSTAIVDPGASQGLDCAQGMSTKGALKNQNLTGCRALAALAEHLGLVASTHPRGSSQPSNSSSLLVFVCTWCTDIHAGKTLITHLR